jgi:8-oxo-dGTP diphosphatase
MLKRIIGFVWRAVPGRLRRGGVWLIEPRFRVTAAAVVINEAREVLLLKHVLRKGSGWGIPGGFLEKGEQPEDALRRELREETGLEIKSAEIVMARTIRGAGQIELLFLCYPKTDSRAEAQSLEIKSARWVALHQLPPELGRDQRRLIERALVKEKDAGSSAPQTLR